VFIDSLTSSYRTGMEWTGAAIGVSLSNPNVEIRVLHHIKMLLEHFTIQQGTFMVQMKT
jgi:hypothetical protein